MLAYCESDVLLLKDACEKFRSIFLAKTDVDPFESAITIASACNIVFRQKFLKEDQIGIIPPGGYRRNQKQSIIALKWLKWVAEKEDIHIQHAGNGVEKQIGKYKVDGFYGNKVKFW